MWPVRHVLWLLLGPLSLGWEERVAREGPPTIQCACPQRHAQTACSNLATIHVGSKQQNNKGKVAKQYLGFSHISQNFKPHTKANWCGVNSSLCMMGRMWG